MGVRSLQRHLDDMESEPAVRRAEGSCGLNGAIGAIICQDKHFITGRIQRATGEVRLSRERAEGGGDAAFLVVNRNRHAQLTPGRRRFVHERKKRAGLP